MQQTPNLSTHKGLDAPLALGFLKFKGNPLSSQCNTKDPLSPIETLFFMAIDIKHYLRQRAGLKHLIIGPALSHCIKGLWQCKDHRKIQDAPIVPKQQKLCEFSKWHHSRVCTGTMPFSSRSVFLLKMIYFSASYNCSNYYRWVWLICI